MFDMLEDVVDGGILLINTVKNAEELLKLLPNKVKNIIYNKHLKVYYINASEIALNSGIKGKISKIK